MGFFESCRVSHPHRVNDIIGGKRVVQTHFEVEDEANPLGEPWVVFEDGSRQKCVVPLSSDLVIPGVKLNSTMDASIWACEFKRIFPESDEGLMLTWFANAIMVGYDTAMRRAEEERDHERIYG